MNFSSSNESKLDSTDESNNFDSNSSDCNVRQEFVFPPAPRLCKSANNTSCSVSCQSDSSISDGKIVKSKKRSRKRNPKILPPIGVFWDIENCQVPRNKSASSIVQKIREIFFDGYREAEFLVVCDVKKENAQVIQDLHDAQVNLIHVSSTSKNAADEKLRQSLRRYAETHPAPSAIVLISGDINFASDLSDLRYRKKVHVILIHNTNVADALILCANETYAYSSITENLPVLKFKTSTQHEILISNLPINCDRSKLKCRLGLLSNNCGGRVMNIDREQGTAVLRFSTLDFASRAQRRLKGEDVFGYKIRASNATSSRESPCRNYTGRKVKGADVNAGQTQSVPSQVHPVPDTSLHYQSNQNAARDNWMPFRDQEMQTKPALGAQDTSAFQSTRGLPNLMNISLDQIWTPQHNSYGDRKTCTPQEEPGGACGFAFSSKTAKLSGSHSDYSEDDKMLHQAGNAFRSTSVQEQNFTPIELVISSLDPSIDIKDLRKILTNLLKEYVMILSLNVSTQADGSPVAIVKVSTQQEAQYAISQLHHYKLGYKRLTISYAQNNMLDPSQLKEMIVALLQEVPGNRMPLFKLIQLLKSQFHTNVSVSEVNKLKDVCRITDELGGRIIALAPEIRTSPPASVNRTSMLYCSVHCPSGLEARGWGEPETYQLPNVQVPLKLFTIRLNHLLSTHMGTLPLLSFPVCYELEYGEPLPVDDSGVPLEHLVTCVSSVELKLCGPSHNIKYIKREFQLKPIDAEKDESLLKSMSPSIISNIQLFCRELVDLLRTAERCQLLLSRFIPAYHHHFGRQCRVADYGYTKLVDLLESQVISNVVQILGDGSKRVVTLTHSAQMRRFTSDLLRVLKGQVAKQLTLAEFASCYERTLSKPFSPVEYGLCTLEDLLEKISENSVVITRSNDSIIIAIPKREQTAEEIVRTKQFAEEVVELLRHSPQCSMVFNKFVPAYHHHFGHQCKVSDYGFSKLIELFEAIPDTVRIEELPDGDERRVCLTPPRALKVLGNQIAAIIRHSKLASLPLEVFPSAYLREYGYPLKPRAYECADVKELVSKLNEFIQVIQTTAGQLLVLVESETQEVVTMRIWAILLQPPHQLNLNEFINTYRMRFQSNVTVSKLEHLSDVVLVANAEQSHVSLKPFYVLAAQLYHIIYRAGGQLPYMNLETVYKHHYNKNVCYADFNVKSMEDLISRLNFILIIKGTRKRTSVMLNQKIAEFGVPLPLQKNQDGQYNRKEDSSLHWPPPPAHDFILNNTDRRITPPKPDTPPAPGSAPWSTWGTPTKFNTDVDLSIPFPAVQTPKLLGNLETLISPTRNLLCAHLHPLGSVLPMITPPHPTELPMPDKLLGKDDSVDSGVNNNSNIASENEMDTSAEQAGAKPKFGSNYNKAFLTYNM